jgi:hypothetical protein
MEPQESKPQQQPKKQQQQKGAAQGAKKPDSKKFDPTNFPLPDYAAKRIEVWEQAKVKRAAEAKGSSPQSTLRPPRNFFLTSKILMFRFCSQRGPNQGYSPRWIC